MKKTKDQLEKELKKAQAEIQKLKSQTQESKSDDQQPTAKVKGVDKISQNPKTINEFVNALGGLLERTHNVRSRLSAIADNLSAGLGDSSSTPMPEVGLGQLYAMEDKVNNQIDELNRIDQILTKLEQVIC